VLSDVIDPGRPLRHDPHKLARSLMRLYYDSVNSPALRVARGPAVEATE